MKVRYVTLEAIFMGVSSLLGIYSQIYSDGTTIKLYSLVFGVLAIFLYSYSRKKNKPFHIWLGVMLYMVLVGYMSASAWPEHTYTFIRLDLASIVYISMGLIFADRQFDNYREKVFLIITMCALAAGLSSIVQVIKGGVSLVDRYVTIQENNSGYVLWGVVCNVFAYAGYSAIFNKKWRSLKTAVVVLYGILGLYFQKRSIIVNIVVMCAIGFFVYSKEHNGKRKLLRGTAAICAILIAFALLLRYSPNIRNLLDSTLLRMTSSRLTDYDRSREDTQFLEKSGFWRTLIGYGIGNYYIDGYGLRHGMLHIGYYNIIYKGGIVYAGFWCYIASKTIKTIRKIRKLDAYALSCLCITISAFVSMVFEFSWGETILPFCYMPFIGYICMLSDKGIDQ